MKNGDPRRIALRDGSYSESSGRNENSPQGIL
jgi:hypothetical protein